MWFASLACGRKRKKRPMAVEGASLVDLVNLGAGGPVALEGDVGTDRGPRARASALRQFRAPRRQRYQGCHGTIHHLTLAEIFMKEILVHLY